MTVGFSPVEMDQRIRTDRQVAMVIDLNKCIGCQSCSVACKQLWTSGDGQGEMWWNKVNTMPGEGSPRGWEDMGGGFSGTGWKLGPWRVGGGEACSGDLPESRQFGQYMDLPQRDVVVSEAGSRSASPDERPTWTYNWDEDQGAGEHPNAYFFYLPRLCNHCTRPACLEACPRDAIYKREDGVVLVDEEECEGYRFCAEACPYKVIYFNTEVERGEIASNGAIAQKCIGCFPRIENGVAPACARQCPPRARFYGFLDEEDGVVHALVEQWEVALPLHPEFNTEPNVYYVPPLSGPRLDEEGKFTDQPRIPLDYLKSLFGDGVEDALSTLREERELARRGETSELMERLIGWRWPGDFFGEFTTHPQDVPADPSDRPRGPIVARDPGEVPDHDEIP